MARIYAQSVESVWNISGSLAASGSIQSSIFVTEGYSRLVGILASSASARSSSGLRISQSLDGSNFDLATDFSFSACSGSGFSIEVVGKAARIFASIDSSAAVFRTQWFLRPI